MTAEDPFRAALIVMALFALAHFGGFLHAARAARHDPEMRSLTEAMRAHRASLLGLRPSILDFREYFSVNFSILLLLGSGVGLVVLSRAHDASETIRALAPIYLAATVLLLGTSLYYSIAQGVVTCAVLAALFALAWIGT